MSPQIQEYKEVLKSVLIAHQNLDGVEIPFNIILEMEEAKKNIGNILKLIDRWDY